ncbi:MAG TPA: orotidine-5'-phosphate decarboxylase, partial [Bacillota bacterium]|nr:orotidine-5'-phosphate decarboxylase [Bacillota bacterium]
KLNTALERMSGSVSWVKVGMELFYREGPDIVRRLKDQGYHIFLDLKMHDIPNTVERAAANLAPLGVEMFNMHAAGGYDMMSRAAAAAFESAKNNGCKAPLLLGVTVLTSIAPEIWRNEIKGGLEVADQVLHFASLVKRAGLNGVVCSPEEVARVKSLCGSEFLTVVPGIRPVWAATGDQKRFTTPAQALAAGADYLVVGRPVMAASDPKAAVERILEEMEESKQ